MASAIMRPHGRGRSFGEHVMGIFGALNTAVTGMRAQSFALENISGNIANSQTTAFKRMDTSFVDMIPDAAASQQLAGSVTSHSRMTNTVQGDVQSSSIGTFMAINGDGFFVVSKPSSFVDNQPVFGGIDNYTRRGDFQPDKSGFLVNGAGYYLMGIPIDGTTGNLVGSVPQLLKFQNDFLRAQRPRRSNIGQILRAIRALLVTTSTCPARNCSIRPILRPILSLGADAGKDHRYRRNTECRCRGGDHRHSRAELKGFQDADLWTHRAGGQC